MISRITTILFLSVPFILISKKSYSTANEHPILFAELGNISNQAHSNVSLYYTKHLNLFPILSPDELKAYLRSIISNPHIKRKDLPDALVGSCENVPTGENLTCVEVSTYSYQDARRILFGDIHLGKSDLNEAYIEPLYCPNRVTHSSIKPFEVPYGSGLNCEHIWPKSRFGVAKGSANYHIMVSDLHHLYPSVSTVNSRRSSNRFGIPTKIKKVDGCQGTFDGPGDYGSVFMPRSSKRGDVARSIFYFALRYGNSIDDREERILRQWDKEDPIDDFEIKKNNLVYKYQGNRNPFIDFPYLLNHIPNL